MGSSASLGPGRVGSDRGRSATYKRSQRAGTPEDGASTEPVGQRGGHTLHEHQAQDRAQYEAFRHFTRGPKSGGTADDLHKLADFSDRGVLTDEELERAKAKVVA